MNTAQQRGVVLIVVLWITVLLTVLLVAFTTTIKVDRDVASDIVRRVQARAGAEAVLNYLVAIQRSGAYDLSAMMGQVYKLNLNSMQIRFRFIPESAYMSLNSAPLEDLETVFNSAGAENAAEIAHYIVQRREGSTQIQTGEVIEPQPWVSVLELSHLPGISHNVYQRVQGWFTVDSDHSVVNLGFAEADFVRALTGAEADQFLDERAVRAAANELQVSTGERFRVQVELSGSTNTRKIEATMAFSNNEHGYHVVRWNEYNIHFSLD